MSAVAPAPVMPASLDPSLIAFRTRPLAPAKDGMPGASHEELPVLRLAHVSGVPEAVFAQSFKDTFGVPPQQYLRTPLETSECLTSTCRRRRPVQS